MELKFKIKDSNGSEWEEDLTVSSVETAIDEAKEVINKFNEEEVRRYGSKALTREVVCVVGEGLKVHQWVKKTAYSDEKGRVVFECKVCKLKFYVSHSSLGSPPANQECHPDRVCVGCNKEFKSAENLKKHICKQRK